jgi:hypothetical protein
MLVEDRGYAFSHMLGAVLAFLIAPEEGNRNRAAIWLQMSIPSSPNFPPAANRNLTASTLLAKSADCNREEN